MHGLGQVCRREAPPAVPARPLKQPPRLPPRILVAELAGKAEEVASLHEAQRSAQSQINMYISDLQVGGGLPWACHVHI